MSEPEGGSAVDCTSTIDTLSWLSIAAALLVPGVQILWCLWRRRAGSADGIDDIEMFRDDEGSTVEVVALFSNPRLPRALGIAQLSFGQELRDLLRAFPSSQLAVEPASTPADAETAVSTHRPSCLLFCGHTIDGKLVLESESGRGGETTDERWLERLLSTGQPEAHREKGTASPAIRCLVLNGCTTAVIGRKLADSHPHLCIVCWSTIAEDSALRAFGRGFFDSIARYNRRSGASKPAELGPTAVDAAFVQGCRAFADAGFSFGDPKAWLHPPGHPHHQRPDLRGCCNCVPPVHGEVSLLRPRLPSELIEGSNADPEAPPPTLSLWVERRGEDCIASSLRRSVWEPLRSFASGAAAKASSHIHQLGSSAARSCV